MNLRSPGVGVGVEADAAGGTASPDAACAAVTPDADGVPMNPDATGVAGSLAPFHAGAWRVLPLAAEHVPELQRFLEANPEYDLAVCGEPPGPDAAQREFDDVPPPELAFGGRALLRFVEPAGGAMVGFASVLTDFLAPAVAHIGLFMVATRLHGSGAAAALHGALAARFADAGMRWIRLGAVVGNARAERFWRRCGYVEVRRRDAIAMGRLVQDVRVMVKPLGAAGIDAYLARVARDRPDSTRP